MSSTLLSLYQKLEKQRQQFSSWVLAATPAQQQFQPSPDQWAAVQVLYHLVLIEKQVLKALDKALATPGTLPPKTLRTSFRAAFLKLFLWLPIKFKAPDAVSEVPTLPLGQVLEAWQETRSKLLQLLDAVPAHHLQKELFQHPRSGMLTLPQTLDFLHQHHSHHVRQLHPLLG